MGVYGPLDTYAWHSVNGEECQIWTISVLLLVCFAAASPLLVSVIEAPYGRYNQAGDKETKWGVMRLLMLADVNAKLAWVLQEIPTLIAAVVCWLRGRSECTGSMGNVVVFTLFVVHYVNRTVIYPSRMRGSKPVPLPIMLIALSFCGVNGYIQCRTLTRYVVIDIWSWTTLTGALLWLFGFCVNIHADSILRNLRQPGETGYKIPHGGAFEYVSGANFFGEIVEWLGFAVAAGGALPALTFAVCTACNIGPRALQHHQWYASKFGEAYPKERKALIPFLL